MTSPKHTALPWREMADGAPTDGRLFLAFSVTIMDEYDEDNHLIRKGVREEGYSILQYAFGSFIEVPWTGAIITNRQFTHWQPLYPPGTEHPQPVTSELLDAAKEALHVIEGIVRFVPTNAGALRVMETIERLRTAIKSTEPL